MPKLLVTYVTLDMYIQIYVCSDSCKQMKEDFGASKYAFFESCMQKFITLLSYYHFDNIQCQCFIQMSFIVQVESTYKQASNMEVVVIKWHAKRLEIWMALILLTLFMWSVVLKPVIFSVEYIYSPCV